MVQDDRHHEVSADVKSYDGLPIPTGASESIWLHDVKGDPLLDYQSEGWEDAADIVIIGSGITGATIAHTLLLHPSCPKRVVMLEARQVCGGATGRNAGHCRPDINRGFGRFAALHGAEQAVKIMHNEQATFEAAMAYIKDHEVDCDLWMGDTLDVYMQDEARASCEANNAAFAAAGGNMSRVRVVKDPEEAERGAKYVEAHQAATLHPWKLVAHMLRSCIRHGLQLYTHTPVTAVEPAALAASAQEWMVRTARGSIRTPVVIHATNGYARSLLPEVHSVIVPQPHLCNRIIPSSSALPSNTADPKQSLSIVDHPVGYSVNPRPDGSVLFGARGHGYEQWTDHLAKDHTRATSDACAAFPLYRQGLMNYAEDRLGIVPDENEGSPMTWTGVQGRSADQVPWIGQVPGKAGQWMCCGHHGHGMARIFTCGPAVAKMVLGATWQETGLPECFEITSQRMKRNVPKLNGH